MTRHCHQCGWAWEIPGQPGRSETCHQCSADLRVCLNCASYDARAAHQCRDRRADPEMNKAAANFCEFFDMVKREWKGKGGPDSREEKARSQLKKLFGD